MSGEVISAIFGAILFCLVGSACFCVMYVERSIKEIKDAIIELLKKEESQSEDCDSNKS